MTSSERKRLLEAGYNESFDGKYIFKSRIMRECGKTERTETATIFIDESSGEISFEGNYLFRDSLMDEYRRTLSLSPIPA